MPRKASDIEAASYLNVLCLGAPKVGKSCTVIGTAPGPVYVINSDDTFSLRPVLGFTQEFEYDTVLGDSRQPIELAVAAAAKGVAEGRYRTIVWDTLTKYVWRVEEVFAKPTRNAAGDADGRRYHPLLQRHIHNVIDRLAALPCHLVVNAHYADVGGGLIDGQVEKEGKGIVPMLPGKLRVTIPAAFQDVIFLDRDPKGNRIFVTSSEGVYGPGSRSLPGVKTHAADIGMLWESIQNQSKPNTKE